LVGRHLAGRAAGRRSYGRGRWGGDGL